jgi:hypothetical protein
MGLLTPVEQEAQKTFGMVPMEERLSILPRYSSTQGLIAPQFIYDLAKAFVSPYVAMQGRQVTPEESLNVAMSAMGGSSIGSAPKGSLRTGISRSAAPTTRGLFDEGWYHGTTGDIKQFRKDLLGEATGAKSAEEGFFFARDPRNPPKEMTMKSNDPETIALLKRLGKTDAEIAALNTVSMKGHGSHTASGYAQLGGDREYREAMRLASIAEKQRNWPEYERQSLIAEDLAIGKNNQLQLLTAQHGEARDTMLAKIKNVTASDPSFEKIMGYGWYNNPAQLNAVKKELTNKLGKDRAADAVNAIDQYKSVVAQRMAAEAQSGANVMPVALRYKNPMYYDFKGSAYRDQTYADLVKEAKAKGHDALILQNTYDPGAGTAKLIDVGVVFEPNQVRSKFAKFDPAKIYSPDILASGGSPIPFGLLVGNNQNQQNQQKKKK